MSVRASFLPNNSNFSCGFSATEVSGPKSAEKAGIRSVSRRILRRCAALFLIRYRNGFVWDRPGRFLVEGGEGRFEPSADLVQNHSKGKSSGRNGRLSGGIRQAVIDYFLQIGMMIEQRTERDEGPLVNSITAGAIGVLVVQIGASIDDRFETSINVAIQPGLILDREGQGDEGPTFSAWLSSGGTLAV
jgi:hypothetical protein